MGYADDYHIVVNNYGRLKRLIYDFVLSYEFLDTRFQPTEYGLVYNFKNLNYHSKLTNIQNNNKLYTFIYEIDLFQW